MLWLSFTLICFFMQQTQAMEFPDITAAQLKSKMDAGEKLILVNPLSDIEFSAEHIPGSVNIPLHLISRSNKLPNDQDHLIVTYCLGRK